MAPLVKHPYFMKEVTTFILDAINDYIPK